VSATCIDVDVRTPSSDDEWDRTRVLLQEYVRWMRTFAGFDPFHVQPALGAEFADLAQHYAAVDRRLFVAWDDRRAVGTVAVQVHDAGAAELRRMYVQPSARGAGVADALLTAAIGWAAASGCDVLWLETMRGPMDPAIAVYRRHDFRSTTGRRPTLDLGDLVVMERALSPSRSENWLTVPPGS
jgi:GNAT superfamily N-acetyltransferase